MPYTLCEQLWMALRSVPVSRAKRALALAEEAGLAITKEEINAHLLARGNTEDVIMAIRQAQAAGVAYGIETWGPHDLAGGDVLEVAKAMAKAKELNREFDPLYLFALDLANREPLQAVESGKPLENYANKGVERESGQPRPGEGELQQ